MIDISSTMQELPPPESSRGATNGDGHLLDRQDPADGLPPLLRRPEPVDGPAPVARLRAPRAALLKNDKTALDLAAATVITAGAVDVGVLHAFASVDSRNGPLHGVNLLVPKPVVNGTLYALPPHRRFSDIGMIPDLRNGRYSHLVQTAMDPARPATPIPAYRTLVAPSDEDASPRPLAILVLQLPNRAALAEAISESMRHTFSAPGDNDYTDSVLQQGIKEPVTLFVLRVEFEDGSEPETVLMTGDGNSRLVSLWLARTGGDIDGATDACVQAVLGMPDRDGVYRGVNHRRNRHSVETMAARIRRGLGEELLTEEARREGHTIAVPAIVIVGAEEQDGSPLRDLVAAKDELLAGLHVHVTPWASGAQFDQGMQTVYRRAHEEGVLGEAFHTVLTNEVGVESLHDLLGLPQHRLWAAALHQHAVLARPQSPAMRRLIRQEFGLAKADRERLGARLGVVALSAYRSQQGGLDRPLNTFANGGTITDHVWNVPWVLTTGTDAMVVLDVILQRALSNEPEAKAELTVLGGTAAILSGLLTRDRGSKEGVQREDWKTPYRATPPRLLTSLASTAGGLRMLHSIARAHVAADATVLPKAFHTLTREIDGVTVLDGQPIVDKAGAQTTLLYEWDLFQFADPILAEETIARNKTNLGANGGSSGAENIPEPVVQRRKIDRALTDAVKAARALARLANTLGRDVFGPPETVTVLRERISTVDEVLVRYGPIATNLIDLGDEDDQ